MRASIWLLAIFTLAMSWQLAHADDDIVFTDGMEEFVVLQGEARYLSPLANALITVSDGRGSSYSTVADGDGKFSIHYTFGDSRALVEVRAKGVAAQSHEEYAGYLGDMDFLLDRAGPGRTLDIPTLPALRLNPFQTGLYVAMRDIPAAASGTRYTEHERRAKSFSSNDFYKRAILLAVLARQDLSLPAGATTILEAVSDEALASAAQEQLWGDPRPCPEHPQCAVIDDLSVNPDQVPLAAPVLDADFSSYLSPGFGSYLDGGSLKLSSGGTGWFTPPASDAALPRSIAWVSEPGNTIRVTSTDGLPLTETNSFSWDDDCSCLIPVSIRTTAHLIAFIKGPRDTVLLGQGRVLDWIYPDNPDIPPQLNVEYPPGIPQTTWVEGSELSGGFDSPSGKTLNLRRCLDPVACGTPLTSSPYSPVSEITEPHHFNANGSGTTVRLGEPFNWQRTPNGVLLVDYASGASAKFMRAAQPTAKTSTTITRFTAVNGNIVATAEDTLVSPYPSFTSAALPGKYVSTIGVAYPFGIALSPGYMDSALTFRFDPGGVGRRMFGSSDDYSLTWQIDTGGRLVFTITHPTVTTPTGTYPQRRTWELLGSEAGSFYVLESIETPIWNGTSYSNLPAVPVIGPTSRILRYDKH